MKIIDLLNKIAKGEELPEIIKVMGATYYLCNGDQSGCCYFSEKQGFGGVRLSFDTSVMNEEVEIIEEDKKIRKLPNEVQEPKNFEEVVYIAEDLARKINEIIDCINKGK